MNIDVLERRGRDKLFVEVFHGGRDVRGCDKMLSVFDAELRNARVEGNGQQADHDV